MTDHPLSPKEKKLRNLRNVLWIVFSAVAITILLVGGLSVPLAVLVDGFTHFSTSFAGETGIILVSVLALIIVKIAVTGIICLVIYSIFKYRLEKDDDLFL